MSQIFVVTNDEAALTAMLTVFAEAGYSAAGAATFEDARKWLRTESPDIILTDERLGLFNGLHLLLTARARHPYAALIVTTPDLNRGLEEDARRLNMHCLVKPENVADWAEAVAELLVPTARVA